MDPRTPVIVGAAALNNRGDDSPVEPTAFMAEAIEAALVDAGAASLRDKIQAIRTVKGIWPYTDPTRLVIERLGLGDHVRSGMTPMGGNYFYDLFAATASDIQAGDLDVAVLVGGETMRTRRRDRAAGRRTEYLAERDEAVPDDTYGIDKDMYLPEEAEVGVHYPINFYALAEVALRHEAGDTEDEHIRRVGKLWAGASDVAAANPDAWFRTAHTADEIAFTSDTNRAVAYPYPKLMTSNVNVDQAGAVVMCTLEAAQAAGVSADKMVFAHSHAGAFDPVYPSHRWSMTESPSMRIAGKRALELAGVGVDDLSAVDLYSCFPAAVQIAQKELGLTADRPFTITGGLTFSGGPMNSYCMQALVRGAQVARSSGSHSSDGGPLLLTGNGGFFSKHSFLVLDTNAPDGGFKTERMQDQVDAMPSRVLASSIPANATVEAYTALYDRDGTPNQSALSCLTADGDRVWAKSTDTDQITELLSADNCGRLVSLSPTDSGVDAVLV